MSVDLTSFTETFLTEAEEHLATLETGLLEMETMGRDADVAAIFRAAHSIKGGAATFGFTAIANFTHVVESVLEHARDGDIEITAELTTELLKSLDIITALVESAREGEETIPEDMNRCLDALNAYLAAIGKAQDTSKFGDASGGSNTAAESSSTKEKKYYTVNFSPKPFLPSTGSDPINILRELDGLGEDSHIVCNSDALPLLEDLIPTDLFLAWDVSIFSDVQESDIADVFMFVEDECEFNIQQIAGLDDKPAASVAEVVTATAMDDRRTGNDRRQNTDRRAGKASSSAKAKEHQSIRVAIDKVDGLINLVGELVTTNAMVTMQSQKLDVEDNSIFQSALSEMTSHTRNLQEAIMAIRMMPIDFAFSRFPRMVRDTAQKLEKKVRLVTEGSQTELDKTVIEQISDPLTHLVRNSVDHGIELPAERVENNKPEEGTVMLAAFYRGGNVIIEIRDDGKGLSRDKILAKAIEKEMITPEQAEAMPDDDVWQLIFGSGFSTAAEVTDVSGRGVGMDVVRKNIQALGGSISIKSQEGVGSCFSISLPLTLAILDGMAIKVESETFILPLLNILESLRPNNDMVRTVQNGAQVIDFRGEYVPLVHLAKVMSVTKGATTDLTKGIAVIVETEVGKLAIFVDDLLGQRQIVIKNIEDNYKPVEGLSGATILGDGSVALIVDLPGLMRLAQKSDAFISPKDLEGAYIAATETAPENAAKQEQI